MIFPQTPKGSPEAIDGAGELLSQGADLLEEGESALSQTARGLSGVAWSGPAEARFTPAAAGLSGVCGGAQEALRICARATRQYAEALATAKRIIERERMEYEDAQIAEAGAGRLIGSLSIRRGMAEPEDQSGFDGAVADAENELAGAIDRSQAAVARAQRARNDFDDAQRTAIGQIEGTAPDTNPEFGSPAMPATGGGFALPALPAFSLAATRGLGAAGDGFGIPPGGLDRYTGVVPFDRLGTVDGKARNSYMQQTGQTEAADVTIAISTAASFGTAGPIAALLGRGAGGAVTRTGTTVADDALRSGAGRTGGSRAAGTQGDDAARLGATSEGRQQITEKAGDALGMGGLPYGGEAGKVVGLLVREDFRLATRIQTQVKVLEVKQAIEYKIAVLESTRVLRQGVRRGLSDDAVARMMQRFDVP